MATIRDNPYGAFNFLVVARRRRATARRRRIIGGFSDVSGLGFEVNYSEYRNGNEKVNTVRKVPNTHKLDDVTLKRGLVGSTTCSTGSRRVRDGQPTADQRHDHAARRGAQAGRHLAPAQRAAEEVDRPDAGRQGRRRGGDGGAAPRARRHHL